MSKGPLYAVIFSVIALITIYFFADIKPTLKEEPTEVEVVNGEEQPELIAAYNKSLSIDDQEWLHEVMKEALENSDEILADTIVSFYENQQQYNFAAYYHTLKAEVANNPSTWELAGDRQLSVSANELYDPTFNSILFDAGIEAYKKALELDGDNSELKVKLGSVLVENSPQPMEGIAMLLEVIEDDSMHVNANLALGKFGLISAQYDKAIIRLEKVLSSQPENKEALFLAADAYANLGRIEEAKFCLEKCKDLVENEEFKMEIDAYLQQLSSN